MKKLSKPKLPQLPTKLALSVLLVGALLTGATYAVKTSYTFAADCSEAAGVKQQSRIVTRHGYPLHYQTHNGVKNCLGDKSLDDQGLNSTNLLVDYVLWTVMAGVMDLLTAMSVGCFSAWAKRDSKSMVVLG